MAAPLAPQQPGQVHPDLGQFLQRPQMALRAIRRPIDGRRFAGWRMSSCEQNENIHFKACQQMMIQGPVWNSAKPGDFIAAEPRPQTSAHADGRLNQ